MHPFGLFFHANRMWLMVVVSDGGGVGTNNIISPASRFELKSHDVEAIFHCLLNLKMVTLSIAKSNPALLF